jgi:hypothetical protein
MVGIRLPTKTLVVKTIKAMGPILSIFAAPRGCPLPRKRRCQGSLAAPLVFSAVQILWGGRDERDRLLRAGISAGSDACRTILLFEIEMVLVKVRTIQVFHARPKFLRDASALRAE